MNAVSINIISKYLLCVSVREFCISLTAVSGSHVLKQSNPSGLQIFIKAVMMLVDESKNKTFRLIVNSGKIRCYLGLMILHTEDIVFSNRYRHSDLMKKHLTEVEVDYCPHFEIFFSLRSLRESSQSCSTGVSDRDRCTPVVFITFNYLLHLYNTLSTRLEITVSHYLKFFSENSSLQKRREISYSPLFFFRVLEKLSI